VRRIARLTTLSAPESRAHHVTVSASPCPRVSVSVSGSDAADPAAMDAAVRGQDAVIDTIGGKTPYKSTTLESSTAKTITDAMQNNRARRLVVTSMIGEGDSAANTPVYIQLLLKTFLRGATPDKAEMESVINTSGLDWIIARPAILTNGPATGQVRVYAPDTQAKAHKITREDLAAFLVAQLTTDVHLRQAVTIANS